MKGFLISLFLIFYFSSSLLAQEKVVDKKFIIVNSTLIVATIFDTETTFASLNKCRGCIEGNSIMRPFFESGRPAAYAVEGAISTGVVYLSYRFKKDNQKLWWVIPVIAAGTHSIAGGFNLRFVF